VRRYANQRTQNGKYRVSTTLNIIVDEPWVRAH